MGLWIVVALLAYGVLSGMVWLRYEGFPAWFAAASAVAAAVVGAVALVVDGSQL